MKKCETCYYSKPEYADYCENKCKHRNMNNFLNKDKESFYLWNYKIERCCANCVNDANYQGLKSKECSNCNLLKGNYDGFKPSEYAIRENERDRIVDFIFGIIIYPSTDTAMQVKDIIYKKVKDKEIETEYE